MKKVVFGTVVYRKALVFCENYIECLRRQSFQDFDLLFINDDFTLDEIRILEDILCKNFFYGRFFIIQGIKKTGYISDYRIQMLSKAYEEGYDLLIIGDIDDMFSINRVEMIYNAYKQNPQIMFYYNSLIDQNGQSVLKNLPNKIYSINMISQCNFLGMSNTAINMKKISKEFIESLYQGSCNIFDWYLYSRLLLLGESGLLVKEAGTIYRIYEGNLAGIQGNSIDEIRREKDVKIEHYKRLESFSDIFKRYKNEISKIEINEFFYTTKNYNENELGYWWNNIQLEEKHV